MDLFSACTRIPRLYLQTDLTQSKIKPPFNEPQVFLSHLLDKSLLSLYASLSLPQQATCVLLTWVIADGWGDLFAQQEAARVLIDRFPQLNLILFSLIHKDRSPPPLKHPFPEHRILYTGPLNQPPIHEALSEKQWDDLNRADLILEMPTAFPHMANWMAELKEPKPAYERFGEHSLIETLPYSPTSAARCMGLHFLERGIFIKPQQTYTWSDLSSHPISDLLFSTSSPSSEQILKYQQTHAFQLNYTKTYRGLYLYLFTLFSALSDDPRDIDIGCFDLPLFVHVLEKRFKKEQSYPQLKAWNIGKLTLYYQNTQTTLSIQSQGKQVRLIHCESMPHTQLLALMHLTDHLIGTTGDQSVLEAIATGKPFFYDPPPLKRSFLKDLAFIARHHLPNAPTLTRFFDLCLKNPELPTEDDCEGWVSEDYAARMEAFLSLEEDTDEKIGEALGAVLLEPALGNDFLTLQAHLAAYHDLAPLLAGLVARGILYRNNLKNQFLYKSN